MRNTEIWTGACCRTRGRATHQLKLWTVPNFKLSKMSRNPCSSIFCRAKISQISSPSLTHDQCSQRPVPPLAWLPCYICLWHANLELSGGSGNLFPPSTSQQCSSRWMLFFWVKLRDFFCLKLWTATCCSCIWLYFILSLECLTVNPSVHR